MSDDSIIKELIANINSELNDMTDYNEMDKYIQNIKQDLNHLLREKRDKMGAYVISFNYEQYFEGQYDLSPWEHQEFNKTFLNVKDMFSYINYEFCLDAKDILTNKKILKFTDKNLKKLSNKYSDNLDSYKNSSKKKPHSYICYKYLKHLTKKHKNNIVCQKCNKAFDYFIDEISSNSSTATIPLMVFFNAIENYLNYKDEYENFTIKIL